jgi:hypothetical protein
MTWVRYDDNVANHPKVAPLDDATYRLWRESIEWCAHNLTDGIIRAFQLPITSVRASKPRANRLVKGGLWHTPGTVCDSPKCPPAGEDGWVIHDYWDYQRTGEQVRADQEATRARQRKWLEKARAGKRNGGTNAGANAPPNGVSDGVSDASYNSNPAPPRPAPKGGEGLRPSSVPPPLGDGRTAGRCDQCGNGRESAYHRNICAAEAAA